LLPTNTRSAKVRALTAGKLLAQLNSLTMKTLTNPLTICHPDGTETQIAGDLNVAAAYRALSFAAERMGKSGYAAHCASRHNKLPFRPSSEHQEVMAAMPMVLSGTMSPEEAFALLHQYDVFNQRMA
jgi:hypothetical protein